MHFKFNFILAGLMVLICCTSIVPLAHAKNNTNLDSKQKAIVPIASFTASGELEKLEQALNEGLNAGLSLNEIKEILVQLYAYTGFPRSLNALATFMKVIEEREHKGIKDKTGKDAGPLPTNKNSLELGTDIQTQLVGQPVQGKLFSFSPSIDKFLKSHLFGDIFGRDNLDFKSREIATLAALANMEGVTPQLQAHFRISINIGLTEEQLKAVISVIESKVGHYQADNATMILAKILGNSDTPKVRKITVTHTREQPPNDGPDTWFTGKVKINTPFKADKPSHFGGANVIFEAGSRTAWHSHELGQLLLVTSGVGHVQRWGEPMQEIREGDIVWIPAHQKHWHGATPDTSMTHIAILEQRLTPATRWMEKVSDEQYRNKQERNSDKAKHQ